MRIRFKKKSSENSDVFSKLFEDILNYICENQRISYSKLSDFFNEPKISISQIINIITWLKMLIVDNYAEILMDNSKFFVVVNKIGMNFVKSLKNVIEI